MFTGTAIFEIVRVIFFWISPLIFLLGLLILLSSPEKYGNLEDKLGREIGGIRKKIIPAIEKNIFIIQGWLMKKRTIVGLLCIICSVIFFFLLKK